MDIMKAKETNVLWDPGPDTSPAEVFRKHVLHFIKENFKTFRETTFLNLKQYLSGL